MISPLEEEKNALTNRPPKSKFESQICVHNLYWRGFSSEVGRNSEAGRGLGSRDPTQAENYAAETPRFHPQRSRGL